jgi:hypothetical protein
MYQDIYGNSSKSCAEIVRKPFLHLERTGARKQHI